jgi:hypothetical protein
MTNMLNEGAFVLYGGTYDTFESLGKHHSKELAYDYIEAIMKFGLFGEIPNEDSELWTYGLSGTITSIKAAKDKYNASVENGKKGGRPKKINKEEVAELKNEGYTNQKVADALNCSLSSVKRANAENRQNINNNNKSNNNEKEKNNVDENYYYDDDYLNSFAAQSEKEIEMMQQRRMQKSVW